MCILDVFSLLASSSSLGTNSFHVHMEHRRYGHHIEVSIDGVEVIDDL